MSQLSKQDLKAENQLQFPNNNSGLITPANLRAFNVDMIDSTVNQTDFTNFSGSVQSEIDNLEAFSSSLSTEFLTTQSFNTYTQSTDIRLNNLESTTASLNVSITNLNLTTASLNTSVTNINAFTQSANQRLTAIESVSGSWITESETASFARVNVTNNFTALQNFTDVVVTGTASVALLNVTIESASVIYSSGSNQFGDAGDDVQTLYGSVRVINELTASGLNYPTADNGPKSFIQTDGAGNLSLQYVDTIWEIVRAGENLAKGTPLYISGSQGANPIVYAADAADPNKMPVTYIAGDNYTANNTYNAIVLGLIEGMDLTGYIAGDIVYVAEGGGWTTNLPSGSNSITQVLGVVTQGGNGGKGLVLNPGPAALPGLQTGFTWVGNGNNRAVAVSTSSFIEDLSGYTTTASFNSYTQSNDAIVNALVAATASFATTGSNTFTGINTFNADINVGYVDVKDDGGFFLRASGSNVIPGVGEFWSVSSQFQVGDLVFVQQPSNDKAISLGLDNRYLTIYKGIDLDPAFDGMDVGQPGLTISSSFGGKTDLLNVLGNISASNIHLTGALTASIAEGFVLVGGAGNISTLVATSSFAGGGSINTSSFATTGSNSFNGNQIITGSLFISSSAISDLVLNGQMFVSSSATAANTQPRIIVSGSNGQVTILRNNFTVAGVAGGITRASFINPAYIGNSRNAAEDEIGITADTTQAFISGWTGNAIYIGATGVGYNAVIGFQNSASWTDGRVTIITPLSASAGFTSSLQEGYLWVGNGLNQNTQVPTSSFGGSTDTGSLLVTASVNLSTITFTKGDQTTFSLTVDTGSGGGGGASFPYSGSVEITGSVKIQPFTLTVVSNTASIDMNESNYFILNLPTSSTTHVTFTNINPGETINLLVSQSATVATGSIAFAPNILFPNGNDYQATATGSAADIVSFISFTTAQVFASQVKNLY